MKLLNFKDLFFMSGVPFSAGGKLSNILIPSLLCRSLSIKNVCLAVEESSDVSRLKQLWIDKKKIDTNSKGFL